MRTNALQVAATLTILAWIGSGAAQEPAARVDLHQSALEGRVMDVMRGLKEGAPVDARDPEGRTALMYAAFNGHTEIVSMLLSSKAKVDARDATGRTALMFAASGPYPETVKLLLDNQADVNAVDGGEKWTPLMFAAGEGHVEVVKVLLAHDAKKDIKDTDGDTALDFAQRRRHTAVVQLLQNETPPSSSRTNGLRTT